MATMTTDRRRWGWSASREPLATKRAIYNTGGVPAVHKPGITPICALPGPATTAACCRIVMERNGQISWDD